MVEVKDVSKLRPELLNMSTAELQRQLAELEMALYEKKQEERRKHVTALVDRINAVQSSIIEGMKLLEEYGLLSDEVKSAYTGSGGTFAPHLKHKPVDADRMLGRIAAMEGDEKPKRKRRTKVEIEAAKSGKG
jgi:hypothetical protein